MAIATSLSVEVVLSSRARSGAAVNAQLYPMAASRWFLGSSKLRGRTRSSWCGLEARGRSTLAVSADRGDGPVRQLPPGGQRATRCRAPGSSPITSIWSGWRTRRSPPSGSGSPGRHWAVAVSAGAPTWRGPPAGGCSAAGNASATSSSPRCGTTSRRRRQPADPHHMDRQRGAAGTARDHPRRRPAAPHRAPAVAVNDWCARVDVSSKVPLRPAITPDASQNAGLAPRKSMDRFVTGRRITVPALPGGRVTGAGECLHRTVVAKGTSHHVSR